MTSGIEDKAQTGRHAGTGAAGAPEKEKALDTPQEPGKALKSPTNIAPKVDVGQLEKTIKEMRISRPERAAMVDVVIPTVGRTSLAVAICAGLSQAYPNTRVVVVGDGPTPCAEAYARWFAESPACLSGALVYKHTARRLGHGNYVKEWWVRHEEAAPYIHFLDDDDWMPPVTIATMMGQMKIGVVLVVSQMIACRAADGVVSETYITDAAFHRSGITTGTMLFSTVAARNAWADLPFDVTGGPPDRYSDWARAQSLERVGQVALIQVPLYWASMISPPGKSK